MVDLRARLMEQLWSQSLSRDFGDQRWRIPPDAPLRLELRDDNREALSKKLKEVSQAFLQAVAREDRARSSPPAPMVAFFEAHIAALRNDHTEAQCESQEACGLGISTDALTVRSEAGNRLMALRQRLDDLRQRRESVTGRIASLHAAEQAEEGGGWVDPDQREAAIARDQDLGEDLDELKVSMAEFRQLILGSGDPVAPILKELIHSVGSLRSLGDSEMLNAAETDVRHDLDNLIELTGSFHDRAKRTMNAWDQELAALHTSRPPYDAEALLSIFDRINKLLGDFLFEANAFLATLEESRKTIAQAVRDAARHYQLLTELGRAAREMVSLQTKFERIALELNPLENFRIDATWQSVRRLSRRIEKRYAILDARLEAESRIQAQESRVKNLSGYESELVELRRMEDEAVAELFSWQDRLLADPEAADAQIRSEESCRHLELRVETFGNLVNSWESQLERLHAQQQEKLAQSLTAGAPVIGMRPINAGFRVAWASCAAVLAFGLLEGVQRGFRRSLR